MKLSELVTTTKGRRATGKLSLDLLKITGKVAVASTAGLVGAIGSAVAHYDPAPWNADKSDWRHNNLTGDWYNCLGEKIDEHGNSINDDQGL